MKNNRPEQLSLQLGLKTPTRSFHGYFQYLQEYDQSIISKDGNIEYVVKTKWMFYVTGFIGSYAGQEEYCYVLMFDKSEMVTSIDSKDRISIDGKKYSREFWNH